MYPMSIGPGAPDMQWRRVVSHLEISASQGGPPQIAVLQFSILQRGHTEVDASHLTAFHIHTFQVGTWIKLDVGVCKCIKGEGEKTLHIF